MSAEVYVTDYGVSLATGDSALDLMLACMADLPLLVPDTNLPLGSASDESHYPVLLRYSDTVGLLPEKACLILEEKALSSDLILLLLPGKTEPQYPQLKAGLQDVMNLSRIEIVYPHQLQKQFGLALKDLQQGHINQLTVLGLDSMIGSALMFDWMEQGKLRTQLNTDGRAVGEGLGWFTLGRQATEQHPVIRLHIGEWISEATAPSHRSPEYHGLALSMQPLLQHLGKEPGTWVYSRRQTPEDDLEAFMAFQYHWGHPKYRQLEQLSPARQTGDLGTAALPAAIALACERLVFRHYKKTSALVSDSHPDGYHFSLLLSTDAMEA